ncbi:VOC family protein [Shewanella sp. NIFS-20-20]|uniref:VOC family protein n=1 Tax=Shewanella sp. NIFS-20-20 TaxID=2853806 RepID=UPI001C49099D|nr:VOC family protein [Shewanella sp. NIFS-20-20]MBV7314455.1 VOC family protein [Shewanella sp. NIFS-20-20]
MNLNHITLHVTNIVQTKAFYLRLGCREIVDTPHYVRLLAPSGHASLSLSLTEQGSCFRSHLYFETDCLADDVARLQAVGIEFTTGIEHQPWLWQEASLFDGEGNKITLFNPHTDAGDMRLNPPWKVATA